MRLIIIILLLFPVAAFSQTLVSTGDDLIFVGEGVTFSSVDGFKLKGDTTNFFTIPRSNFPSNVWPASKRVAIDNPKARFEIRDVPPMDSANFFFDAILKGSRVQADVSIRTSNSQADYQAGLEQVKHPVFRDIPVIWTLNRSGSLPADTHQLVFVWDNALEDTLIPGKRLFVRDYISGEWLELQFGNTVIDEANNTLTYNGFEGQLKESRFLIAQPTPINGDLYVVDSGGDVENSTWIYENGMISTLKTPAYVNASDVLAKLAIDDLVIRAKNITVDSAASIAKTTGGDASLTFMASDKINHYGSISSTSGELDVVLWVETDGGTSYGVHCSDINTNGGNVWIGGGQDTSVWHGLLVGGSVSQTGSFDNINAVDLAGDITTGGGDVLIAADDGFLADNMTPSIAAFAANRTIDAGAGGITLLVRDPSTFSYQSFSTTLKTTGTVSIAPPSGEDWQTDFAWAGADGSQFVASGDLRGLIIGDYSTLGGLTLGTYEGSGNMADSVYVAANTRLIAFDSAVSVNGKVLVYSDTVHLRNDISSTGSGTQVLIHADNEIYFTHGADVTTAGGDIILWSNRNSVTSASTAHRIALTNGSTLTSNGGNIVFGGGADGDSDGYPDGYAYVGSSDSTWSGITFIDTVTLFSGNGNITLKGQSGASADRPGIDFAGYVTMNAGTGVVHINGITDISSNAEPGNHEVSGIYSSGTLKITSESDSIHAITLIGNATGAQPNTGTGINSIHGISFDGEGMTEITATGSGGGIQITSIGDQPTQEPIFINDSVYVLAVDGPINIAVNGGNSAFHVAQAGKIVLGSTDEGNTMFDVTSSSSAIVLESDLYTPSAKGQIEVNTTDSFSIYPVNDGTLVFPDTLTLSDRWNIHNNLTALIVGGADNSSVVQFTDSLDISGWMEIFGGDILIRENLNTVNGALKGDILLKAKENIVLAPGKGVRTNGGDLIFWSNSDAEQSNGGVYFDAGSSVRTGGGAIWIGGSNTPTGTVMWDSLTVGDGFAVSGKDLTNLQVVAGGGQIQSEFGILLNGVTIQTGGGNLRMAGKRIETANDRAGAGIGFYNASIGNLIDVGTGSMTIIGQTNDVFSGNIPSGTDLDDYGLVTAVNPDDYLGTLTFQSSNTTDSIAITLMATTASGQAALYTEGHTRILSTGATTGGGIFVGGTSSQNVGIMVGGGTKADTFDILSASGKIVLDAGTDSLSMTSQGLMRLGSVSGDSDVSASSALITLISDDFMWTDGSVSVNSTDTLKVEPSPSQSFTTLLNTAPLTYANLGGLVFGHPENTAGNVAIRSAISLSADVSAFGQDIAIDSSVTAISKNILLTATGRVTQTSALTSNGLALNGTGQFILMDTTNNIVTIAAGDTMAKPDTIMFTDASGGLTIGSVNPDGMRAVGPILVQTLQGDITIEKSVASDDGSDMSIVINAGERSEIGDLTGGSIKVKGFPSVTPGSGGIAKLFSSSITQSSGLNNLVGLEQIREGVDETTTMFDPTLVADKAYALYRYMTPVEYQDDTTLINGDKIGIRKWFTSQDPGTDDATSYVFDFLVPTTVDTLDVFIYGGGGGGAGATFGNWEIRGGGGGGGGAEVRRFEGLVLIPEEILTFQAGRNGFGGSGDANGTDGDNSFILRDMDTLVLAGYGRKGQRGRESSSGGAAGRVGQGGTVISVGQTGMNGSKTTMAPDDQAQLDNSGDAWWFKSSRVAAGAGGGGGRDCSFGSGSEFGAGGPFSNAAGVLTTGIDNRAGGNGEGGDDSFDNSDNGTINAVPASGAGGGGGGFTASSNGKGGGNGGAGSVLIYFEPASRSGSTLTAEEDSILVMGDSTIVTLQLRDENGTAANISVGPVEFHTEGPPVIMSDVVDNLDGTYSAMMYSIWESGKVIISATIQDSSFSNTDTVTIYATPDNANLAKLDVTLGSIYPDFHPDTLVYTDTIIGPDYVFLIPQPMNENAKVEVNGVVVAYKDSTEVILLTPGDTVFTIVVTSQDMTKTKTYQLTLTKLDLSSFGGLTVVSTGADAEGTTWTYAGGVLTPTSAAPANVLSDSVEAKLALGDLYMAASKITIDDPIETDASSNLTLKSTSDIIHNDGKHLILNGGNLVYWADSDSTGGGSIQMLGSTAIGAWAGDIRIWTKGGDIFMGGNRDTNYDGRPDGFPRSNATYRQGLFTSQVLLDATVDSASVDSLSGSIFLYGWSSNENNSPGDSANGLWVQNTRLYANKVTMNGEHAATGSIGQGMDLNALSNLYAYGDVTLNGKTGSSAHAIQVGQAPSLSSTAGNISFGAAGTMSFLSTAGLQIGAEKNITIDVSTDATFNTPISGAGGFVKKGSGALTVQNTLSYTDTTQVESGTIKAHSASDSSALVILSGATYDLQDSVSTGGLSGAGSLLLNSNGFRTGTLSQVDTFSGTISGSGNFTKAGTGVLVLTGTVSYSGTTTIDTGGLTVIQDNPVLSTSGISGSGSFAFLPQSKSFSSDVSWNVPMANSLNGLTIGKDSNMVAITLTPLISISGPVTLYGSSLTFTGGLYAPTDTVRLHATSTVSQTGGLKAGALALFGPASYTLTHTSNAIGIIAGGDSLNKIGALALVDSSGGLTIGEINPKGINSTGSVRIETLEGDINLLENVITSDGTDSALVINAGKSAMIGEAFGGTLLVGDSVEVGIGAGGIARFYSSADPLSTGLRKLIGGDTLNIRKEVDETTMMFDPPLLPDSLYALYRTGNCVPPVDGGEIAGVQTICKNQVPVPLTSVDLPLGSVGILEYKWQESTTDSTSGFADISGDTDETTYAPGNIAQTTWFRRIGRVTCLDDEWDSADTSNSIVITISDTLLPGSIQTAGEVICKGGTPSQIASGTAPTGGAGNYQYTWRSSADMYMADISGADSATYTPPSGVDTTTTYRRYVSDGACQPTPTQSTGEWTVTVRASVSAGAIDSVGESICSGGSPSQITSSAAASGGDGAIMYSWRSSADNFGADISSSNSPTYTPPSGLTMTTTYRRYATDGTCAGSASQSAGEWVVSVPAGLAFTNPDGTEFSPYQLQNTPFGVRVTLVDANGDAVPSPAAATITLSATGGTGVGQTLSFADGSTPVSRPVAEDSAFVNFSKEGSDYRVKFSGLSDSLSNDPDIMLTASMNVCSGFSQTDSITSRDRFFDIVSAETFLIADGADSSRITVTLKQASDSSAMPGDTLWVQTSAGRLDFTDSGILSDTGVTDANGQFQVTLYADTLFDTAAVFANMIGADPRFVYIPFVGETPFADSCSVELTSPHNADSIDASTLTLILKDHYGNPVPYKVESDFTVNTSGIPEATVGGFQEVGNGVYMFSILSPKGGTLSVNPEASGISLASKSVLFECEQPLSGGQIGMDQSICSGSVPNELTNISSASGFKGVLQYQWQDSTATGTWAIISGGEDSTYQPPALSQETWYRRLASVRCGAGIGVVSNVIHVMVEESPFSGGVTRYPDIDILCAADSISADFTDGVGGNGMDTTQYRFYGKSGWTVWAPYVSGQDIARTNQDTLQIRTIRLGDVCDAATPEVVSWAFEQVAKPAELVKSPAGNWACVTDSISATYTTGKGGNGIDTVEYRVHDGTSWGVWSLYPSDSMIVATNLDSVEIRSKRYGTYCSNSDYNVVKWATEEVATAGTLTKSPDITGVCVGSTISANYTAGTGGNGVDSLQYRTYNGTVWSSWTEYPSDSQLVATGIDTIVIRARRMAEACEIDSVLAIWIVEDTAITATISKMPNTLLVCEEDSVSATVMSGIGGNGVDTMDYRRHDGTIWSNWTLYTAGDKIANAGYDTIEVRTRRNASFCANSEYSVVRWNVNQYPVAGTLTRFPDQDLVCEGTPISASLTPGQNGNGVDSIHFRTHDGTSWSSWMVYGSGNPISTGGKDSVQIRTRRMDDLCESSDYKLVSWSVEPTPVTGSLTKSIGSGQVCNGSDVAATLTPGTGGNGKDTLEVRTHDGSSWTQWMGYTSGSLISSAGKDTIQVRTRRLADVCSVGADSILEWEITRSPVTEITTTGPACFGDTLTLSEVGGDAVSWQWAGPGALNSTSSSVVLNGAAVGLYSVVTTGATGCTGTDTLEVYGLPSVRASNGGPYCSKEDIIRLYEKGGGGIAWNWTTPNGLVSFVQNPVISPAVNGNYIVEVTSAVGCKLRDTTFVCVGKPIANCVDEVELYLGVNNDAVLSPTQVNDESESSSCLGIKGFSLSQTIFSCADVGTNAVQLTVLDSAGCEDQCVTNVVVVDSIVPEVSCQEVNELILVWSGTAVYPSAMIAEAEDNCAGALQFSFSPDFSTNSLMFNCRELLQGPVDLTVFVKDQGGNMTQCVLQQVYPPHPASEDCSCDGDELVLENVIVSDDYKASKEIIGSGVVSSGDTVLLKAEERITLLPGFTAMQGSRFSARIDSCGVFSESLEGDHDQKGRSDGQGFVPEVFHSDVYPNPFKGQFVLGFSLPVQVSVTVRMQAIHGGDGIGLLSEASFEAGYHQLTIDGSRLAPGLYILTLNAGDYRQSHRIIRIQ